MREPTGATGKRISGRALIAGVATACLPISATRSIPADLGDRRITSVSDGNLVLPLSFLLPEVLEADARPFLSEHGLSTDRLEPECDLTLLEDGDRLVHFDAGAGPNFMPMTGLLSDALAQAGVELEAVTDVIFTHAHPDHLWGILDDFDEITFPEAQLHVGRREWDFWRASGIIESIGEAHQVVAVGAQNRFAAMEDRVQPFDAGAEVVSGVEAVDMSGHTPGHMSFAVHAGSEYVMVLGDALTNPMRFHSIFRIGQPDRTRIRSRRSQPVWRCLTGCQPIGSVFWDFISRTGVSDRSSGMDRHSASFRIRNPPILPI